MILDAIHEQMSIHRNRYKSFQKVTGWQYKDLVKLHERAVESLDLSRQNKEYPTEVLAIRVEVLAYLTDIALQHIAIGAEIREQLTKKETERVINEALSSRNPED